MGLLVAARIAPSSIHGLGLFADEPIPAGTVIWRFHPGVDSVLTQEQVAQLPDATKRQVLKYSYFCREIGKYVLCGDDARHMNHSSSPNTASTEGFGLEGETIASRDIQAGEELTTNYDEYDIEGSAAFSSVR